MTGLRYRAQVAVHSQDGYALLLVMCMVALLTISLSVVQSNALFQDRREKEKEMIWRGKQYVRGIRLYYQKTHHFPVKLEDLYQAKTGIRFMRKEYKDPMNTADGSWRLIYVGPSGQLLGSLTQPTTLFPGNVAKTNLSASLHFQNDALSGPAYSSKDPLGSLGNSTDTSSFGAPANAGDPQAPPSSLAPSVSSSTNTTDSTNAQSGLSGSGLQSLTASSDADPPITSNPIIGVGSKIDKRSIIWLDGAKDYLHFEFIYKSITADPKYVTPSP